MTAPTLLASREALARALCHGDAGGHLVKKLRKDPCPWHIDQADALLASGVVRDVDGLAGDEALVERVADERWHRDTAQATKPMSTDLARMWLRALAAALGGVS